MPDTVLGYEAKAIATLKGFAYISFEEMSTAHCMASSPSNLDEIISAIVAVAKEIGATRAILFGSFARGTPSARSDVDVIFIQETDERFVQRPTHALRSLYQRIRGRAIDVFIYTPAELDMMKDAAFLKRIFAEGKTVYES